MAETGLKAMAHTRALKLGHFIVEFATPGIGHIMKNAGCEFVLFDLEHSGFGYETVKSAIRYFEAADIAPIVRVPSKEYHHIARACDMGAEGVMLPMVGSAAEARAYIEWLRRELPGRAILIQEYLPGAEYGVGLIGNVDDDARNVNAQPLIVVPDDAPVIAAVDANDFCLPANGDCEVLDFWEVTPSEQTEQVAFFFDNRDAGIVHNVEIAELEGTVDDPQRGEVILASELVTGPVVDGFLSADVTWDELPAQWYFFCVVHPNMNGVGQVVSEG